MKSKINESIKHLDLEDCVEPIISLDEFEPKTGDEQDVIVVSFFCIEENVAKDLKSFLERGVLKTLDIDTSPNPDENGKYLVFVEFKRDKDFYDSLEYLIKEVEMLSGKMDWSVRPYLNEQLFDLSDDEWKNYVILDPENYMTRSEFENSLKETIQSFFDYSDADTIGIDEGMIAIDSNGLKTSFFFESIVDVDEASKLMENEKLKQFHTIDIRRLEKVLGNHYSVYVTESKIFVDNNKGKALILKRYE